MIFSPPAGAQGARESGGIWPALPIEGEYMGFEELATELHKGADAEGKKIIHAAEKNAAKIEEDAKEKAEESLKAAKKDASEFARQEAAERITSAKLAAKKMVDEAREEAVEASISQAWNKFRSDSMKKPFYQSLLEALVKEGMAELGASQAIVYARDEDKQYLQGCQFKRLPQEYVSETSIFRLLF